METVLEKSLAGTSSTTPWARKLYRNADKFWDDATDLHHSYLVYRTLKGYYKDTFKPDAVLYVGKSPAAYLKTVKTNNISEQDVQQWQRFLWNQTVVPILIVKSRTKIQVYTAYTKPEGPDSTNKVTSILDTVASTLKLDKLLNSIESGTIYGEKPESFDRNNTVDSFLLKNLNSAAHELAKTQKGGLNKTSLEFTHQFLTRLLFVCNLIERGMIKGEHFEDEDLKKLKPALNDSEGYSLRHLFSDLSTYTKRKHALCRIFARVKERFNGSLFPDSITSEKDSYTESFISKLNLFLQGYDLSTSQLTFDFWNYDFSVIPIETISSVYESFLDAEGKVKELQEKVNSKRTSGAYYTPLHLAELTVDIALESIEKPIHELKVLDPACGSGVFLVSMFGRMANSLRREKNYAPDGDCNIKLALDLEPLLGRLYGIDINPTACHITCFSLYLALLEQLSPMDVEFLRKHNKHKKALHQLLARKKDSYDTIHHGNLFDPNLSLKEKDFDLIIGNPPWVSRTNQKDEIFLKWMKRHGKKQESVLGPDKQIAHGFMWKAPEYLSDSGIACLLLPTSVLLNDHTNRFQSEWFNSVTVDRVVNLSDLRFILFAEAVHPCVAIRFKSAVPDMDFNIRYESPKTDIRSQQGGPVYIREEDTASLRKNEIVNAANCEKAPLLWKSRYWGSWRDQQLLSRLHCLPKLNEYVGTIRKPKRFIKGQGFQAFNPRPDSDVLKIRTKKEPEKPWWTPDMLFLAAQEITDLVVSSKICKPVGDKFKLLLFPRTPELFKGPKVLIIQGSQHMKVAYCNFDVIFQSALQSITGKTQDSDLLRFLSVVINSDVMQYYLFHTSSSWGIERDKVLFYELLYLPFFLPEDAAHPKDAQKIVSKVVMRIKEFENSLRNNKFLGEEDRIERDSQRIRKEFEPLIRKYYDIDKYEAMLIDDTIKISRKSLHPRQNTGTVATLKSANGKNQQRYTQTLCEMLNNFGKASKFKVNGEVIKGQPYSIIHINLANRICKTIPVVESDERLAQIFNRMESLLEEKEGRFVFCQRKRRLNLKTI